MSPHFLRQRLAPSGIRNPLLCFCSRKCVQGLTRSLFSSAQCLHCARCYSELLTDPTLYNLTNNLRAGRLSSLQVWVRQFRHREAKTVCSASPSEHAARSGFNSRPCGPSLCVNLCTLMSLLRCWLVSLTIRIEVCGLSSVSPGETSAHYYLSG